MAYGDGSNFIIAIWFICKALEFKSTLTIPLMKETQDIQTIKCFRLELWEN